MATLVPDRDHHLAPVVSPGAVTDKHNIVTPQNVHCWARFVGVVLRDASAQTRVLEMADAYYANH